VDLYWTYALGDDWQCTETGPVTDIHFWASWVNNDVGTINDFWVSIWSDNPVGPGGHSEPNQILWNRVFTAGDFTVRRMTPDWQGWFEPDIGEYWENNHNEWCQVNIEDIDDPFPQKEGEIYWLVIADVNVSPAGSVQLGWKESGSPHFRDDAVWWNWKDEVWEELTDPLTGETMDLAFVITGEEYVKHKNLKWSQPPIEIDPCAPEPIYCGWDEPSYTVDPDFDWLIVADDYRCLGSMPVTSVHWWGSHQGWEEPDIMPPELPMAWRIGFWSNVPAPADPTADPNYSYPEELLWQIEVPADRVDVKEVGYDEYPEIPFYDICYQYYLDLEPNEWFWQGDFEPNTIDDVFWLSIAAIYPAGDEPQYPWGWKTRPWPWMDDAVSIWLTGDPGAGIVLDPSQIQPIVDPLYGDSFDVAFELDTDPNYIKHEQPFTGIRNWPHYEDQNSMATVGPVTETKWVQWPDESPNGVDVDDTNEIWDDGIRLWLPQILADDFNCPVTGPITDIHIWGSWYHDEMPNADPMFVDFTLSIYSDDPCGGPGDWSEPNKLLWSQDFAAGDFFVLPWATELSEGYYSPCIPYYESDADWTCYRYSFYIAPCDAFMQRGEPNKPVVYWLVVEATPLNTISRFGWKTSTDHWNDNAVWAVPNDGLHWNELEYPDGHPFEWDPIDLAFEITTETEELNIKRLVADDWPCDQNTPITAAVWWGSYIGYRYEACVGPQPMPPVRPDYFWLAIWTDVPANVDLPYSHPNDIIWEYMAKDYDEVLVGFDKYPEGEPNEPVFRYSVRLPHEAWFLQDANDGIYWFSVVAVYDENTPPHYDWGWTNHRHVYNDDAVEGYWDPPAGWFWDELYDQTGLNSVDMSFILFTDPEGYTCWDPLECAGQPLGDATCDGTINFADLGPLKISFFKSKGQPGYNCCADFTRDGVVNFADLSPIKINFFTGPHNPATGNLRCPP
jgi:hypothetical protein